MSSGMVRKIDELGRVVIPKEMRRILNIKTGSSVEMIINKDKEVVLKKFSEIDNLLVYAEQLSNLIFDNYQLANFVCDDDKILICRGNNKKNFANKQIIFDNKRKNGIYTGDIVQGQDEKFDYQYIIAIKDNGYNAGFVVLVDSKEIDKTTIKNIEILCTFVSVLLES